MTLKFSEDKVIAELAEYIDSTYKAHYASSGNIQTTEFIMDQFDDGRDFLRGCALKYLARWGKKDSYSKKDLLKAMHYCILLMHWTYYSEDANDNSEENQPVS